MGCTGVGRGQAPGSSLICLSGKTPKIGPQIPYNLRLKSPTLDRAVIHVMCHICDPAKKSDIYLKKFFSAERVQEAAWGRTKCVSKLSDLVAVRRTH